MSYPYGASHGALVPADSASRTQTAPGACAPRDEVAPRKPQVMRKFEVTSLAPDGGARSSHHLAPATPLFEQLA